MTYETITPAPAFMTRIRNQIRAAEAKADASLMAKLDVMRSILHVRQFEDLPAPHLGQEAIIRLGRAVQSDINSANDVFRSHNALVDAKIQITGGPGHGDTLAFAEEEEIEHQAVA